MKLSEAMPPDLVIKAILVRGGGFKATYTYWREAPKERFFFVANRRPESDETIVILTATTQVDQRRVHHGARADIVLVSIEPGEYPDFRETSVIDCDCALIKRPRSIFLEQARQGLYKPLPSLPHAVFDRICVAVSEARRLSSTEKRLILDPEPEPDP